MPNEGIDFPSDIASERIVLFAISAAVIALSFLQSEITEIKIPIVEIRITATAVHVKTFLACLLFCLTFVSVRFYLRVQETLLPISGNLPLRDNIEELRAAISQLRSSAGAAPLTKMSDQIESTLFPNLKMAVSKLLKEVRNVPPEQDPIAFTLMTRAGVLENLSHELERALGAVTATAYAAAGQMRKLDGAVAMADSAIRRISIEKRAVELRLTWLDYRAPLAAAFVALLIGLEALLELRTLVSKATDLFAG